MSKADANKKKRIWTILFILLNITVIGITAISEFAGGKAATNFRDIEIKWGYIIPAFICCFGAILTETYKYSLVAKKLCGYADVRMLHKMVWLGRYYDNITPFGAGGQPFQIVYLNKNGISSSESAAIPLSGFLSMQFGFVLLALFSFIFLGRKVESDIVRVSSYIGLCFYAFVPIVILVFTFFPNAAMRILKCIVNLLYKIHIIKDKEKSENKVCETLLGYTNCIKRIAKSKKLCVMLLLLGILYQFFIAVTPYFVVCAFGGHISFLESFVTTLGIYAAITFIPTPGNAGAAEGSFYLVFSSLTKGYIFWAMLLWRFFSYYIFIIAGLFVYLGNRKRNNIQRR